ncbi:MAG: hypothetical protein ACSHX8_11075 [Opitutaceae bacterium]
MLNLAPTRYAKAMESTGGPIARMEHANADVFGEPCVHAVTYLKDGIVGEKHKQLQVTEQPDGAGCHATTQIACYMAISEAMERWAVHSCRKQGGGGIDLDGSSNGFAAFPGLFRRQARGAAFRESIERHCLICWWEGLLRHQCTKDPWPDMSAISIENPFSSHSVILIWSMTEYGHAYAFGAGDTIKHATGRALVEMDRIQSLLKQLSEVSQPLVAGERGDVFERRIRFFSTDQGKLKFLNRLKQEVVAAPGAANILFDSAVKGPWDAYASVWRTIIEAPSRHYLGEAENYFFW